MLKRFRWLFILLALGFGVLLFYIRRQNFNPNPKYTIGQAIDSFNGVKVFYNGMVGHSGGRNTSADGYNIGIKYQCVEFVKRYYFEHYQHKMPDTYGNAKDFFDTTLADGQLNTKRDLLQFRNPSQSKPATGDLLVFDGHASNIYGHVAIVSAVGKNEVELIQQNPGPFAPSRVKFPMDSTPKGFVIRQERLLGWLRIKSGR